MNLNEFIKIQQSIFNLEKNTDKRIKAKILRLLKNDEEWKNLVKKRKNKNHSTQLSTNIIKKLESKLEEYLLKLANIDKKEFDMEKNINEIDNYNKNSQLKKAYNNDIYENPKGKYSYIPKQEIDKLMTEALFYKFFDIDFKKWNEDYLTISNWEDDIDENAIKSNAYNMLTYRLKNPRKFYLIEKNK